MVLLVLSAGEVDVWRKFFGDGVLDGGLEGAFGDEGEEPCT